MACFFTLVIPLGFGSRRTLPIKSGGSTSLGYFQSQLAEKKKSRPNGLLFYSCDPAGIRTQDPYIKSVLLYQLSYRIIFFKRIVLHFSLFNLY